MTHALITNAGAAKIFSVSMLRTRQLVAAIRLLNHGPGREDLLAWREVQCVAVIARLPRRPKSTALNHILEKGVGK